VHNLNKGSLGVKVTCTSKPSIKDVIEIEIQILSPKNSDRRK
jgi:hypothetical protein